MLRFNLICHLKQSHVVTISTRMCFSQNSKSIDTSTTVSTSQNDLNHDQMQQTKETKAVITTRMHPWLLSTDTPRLPKPSIWQRVKRSQTRKVNMKQVAKLLQEPAYCFPADFYQDAEVQIRNMFNILSYPNNLEISEQVLQPFMLRKLYGPWLAAHEEITLNGGHYNFKPKSNSSFDETPISLKITDIHCTFGPYPVPQGYVAQDWGPMTLVIPQTESQFQNYVHQKNLQKLAQDEGVYIEIDVNVKMPMYFELFNSRQEQLIARDYKDSFNARFISPHFGPWDEIFQYMDDDTWKLRWEWRLSDIDDLLESKFPRHQQSTKIDWFSHRREIKMFQPNSSLARALDFEQSEPETLDAAKFLGSEQVESSGQANQQAERVDEKKRGSKEIEDKIQK